MNGNETWRQSETERGIALLLSIFALLLISAVGISLIYMAGTESNIAGNYRLSTIALLAAQGGAEEGRERLMPAAPDTLVPCADTTLGPCSNDTQRMNALKGQVQGFFDFDPLDFAVNPPGGRILYILNPATGENVNPTDTGTTNPTRDTQYFFQFGAYPPASSIADNLTSSFGNANTANPVPYKWIRLTMKTERAVNTDYNGDGAPTDNVIPIFYDANTNRQRFPCDGTGALTAPPCYGRDERLLERDYLSQSTTPVASGFRKGVPGVPVYQVTALAVTPTGSRRLVQYEVSRISSINAAGAVVSQAPVTTNGNFQVFGSYPPIVSTTYSCGTGKAKVTRTLDLCGMVDISSGKAEVDPSKYGGTAEPCPFPAQPPVCCAVTPCPDYCGIAPPVDGIESGGSITINGANSVVPPVPPQTATGCSTSQTCVYTQTPQSGASANATIPYDINEMVASFAPPVSEYVTDANEPYFSGVSCTGAPGSMSCSGNGAQLGVLPTVWPPLAGVQGPYPGNVQRIAYADGNLRLQGHSTGSGILVVNGDLDIGSGFEWFGLLVVKGVVSFSGGGGSPTNIIGSIIAGQSVVNNNTTLGGGVNVIYDACAFKDSSRGQAFRVLSFRELLETAR